jgi:hypothetical protein
MNRIALVDDHERLAEHRLRKTMQVIDSRLQIVNIRALGHALREATLAP